MAEFCPKEITANRSSLLMTRWINSMASRSAASALAGIERLRSATTTTVPARLGSLMAKPHSASKINDSNASLATRKKREDGFQTHHAANSGIARSSQIGLSKVIIGIVRQGQGCEQDNFSYAKSSALQGRRIIRRRHALVKLRLEIRKKLSRQYQELV